MSDELISLPLGQSSQALPRRVLEQVKRIELLASAWKAEVLPLYDTCKTGLSREDRTPDLLLPKQAHYLAVLYSEKLGSGTRNCTENEGL
jgi:hypothetical protein